MTRKRSGGARHGVSVPLVEHVAPVEPGDDGVLPLRRAVSAPRERRDEPLFPLGQPLCIIAEVADHHPPGRQIAVGSGPGCRFRGRGARGAWCGDREVSQR